MPDTDPRLAIKQVVSAPGFWNQPKEQQVQAIGQIYPKIASAPQDVQDRILAQGRVALERLKRYSPGLGAVLNE